MPVDEPEVAERPQIAVDRRERHVEQRAQLVGPNLAAVGDGQEQSEAAGERRVLGGFLGRPVAGRGHRGFTIRRFSRCGNWCGAAMVARKDG